MSKRSNQNNEVNEVQQSDEAAVDQAVETKEPSKTQRIMELHEAGKSRSQIAQELGIRYQHVRNTLVRKGAQTATQAAEARKVAQKDNASEAVSESVPV